ncbi:MAG TPA: thioredoxin family protein [Mycobacteriales bacterium]|nr:thioredoxin family protein [Mycobacteriales bacterium]
MTGVWVVLAVLVLSTAFGLAHRARSGRIRTRRAGPGPHDGDDLRPVLATLGQTPGERATLLQFSSAFCAPCRATRRILSEVEALLPGVKHVELDAEQHLDLVRRLDISKTPTTLVLDADARVRARAVGQPRKAEVVAAVADAVP